MARYMEDNVINTHGDTLRVLELDDETMRVDMFKLQVLSDLMSLADTCYDCTHENTKGERIDYIPVDAIKQYFGGEDE